MVAIKYKEKFQPKTRQMAPLFAQIDSILDLNKVQLIDKLSPFYSQWH